MSKLIRRACGYILRRLNAPFEKDLGYDPKELPRDLRFADAVFRAYVWGYDGKPIRMLLEQQ